MAYVEGSKQGAACCRIEQGRLRVIPCVAVPAHPCLLESRSSDIFDVIIRGADDEEHGVLNPHHCMSCSTWVVNFCILHGCIASTYAGSHVRAGGRDIVDTARLKHLEGIPKDVY